MLKEYTHLKGTMLSSVLSTASRQLQESEESLEKLKSVSDKAKTPSERTLINTLMDDQKKVIKALQRLASDISSSDAS